MAAILVDSSRIERSQTVDEAGLMNDLRSSSAFSGFVSICGFDDLWGVEEGREGGTGG